MGHETFNILPKGIFTFESTKRTYFCCKLAKTVDFCIRVSARTLVAIVDCLCLIIVSCICVRACEQVIYHTKIRKQNKAEPTKPTQSKDIILNLCSQNNDFMMK